MYCRRHSRVRRAPRRLLTRLAPRRLLHRRRSPTTAPTSAASSRHRRRSSEGEEEPETPTPRRREVEAAGARVWLFTYDSADGRRGAGAVAAQPRAQLRLQQRPRGGAAPRVRLPGRPARPGGGLVRVPPLAPHRRAHAASWLTELTMQPMYHSPIHSPRNKPRAEGEREKNEEKKERRGYGW
jgi:hypothetical protein